MDLVKKFSPTLLAIFSRKSPYVRERILINAQADLIKVIVFLIFNVMNGSFDVTKSQRFRLQRHALFLRKLIRLKSIKEAKTELIKHGVEVLPLFASIINDIIKRQ